MNIYNYAACFLLGIFSITFLHHAGAQSKEEFEKIFLKETQGLSHSMEMGSFKNVAKLSYYPDTLPAWFFTPPRSTADYIYAIGISDPDQTPQEATEQAVFRAKALAVLQNKSQIQYFRDVYTILVDEHNETNYRQRFDTYFKLSATGEADSLCFTVVHNHLTRYNEAVVLLRYENMPSQNNENASLMSAIGTVLFIEAQVGEAFEPQAEYEFISAFKTSGYPLLTSQFTYREKGNRFFVISEFADKPVEYPLYVYRYANPGWEPNTHPMTSYNGLWGMYAQNLLKHLTLTTEQSSKIIKTLGEHYTDQLSNLTREVAIKTTKIFINGIDFGEEGLDFDLLLQEVY